MQIAMTEKFLKDFQGLSGTLSNKCRDLMSELKATESSTLRQNSLPGWRLHTLRDSSLISLSIDMNFRALAELKGNTLVLHRVVKHDTADRADVNRNSQAAPMSTLANIELQVSQVYDALRSFGVPDAEAVIFRDCRTEDELLSAASSVSNSTGTLALTLYETSGMVIPRSRFRVLQKDEDLALALETGGGDWEMYLHPSQSFIVELPTSFRAAVIGSAGTGKTVCAWYRTKHLIDCGASVGFVCPNKSILNVSKAQLLKMVGEQDDHSYFLVPRVADELVQLAEAVDHVIVDEAQEIPPLWLVKLGEKIRTPVGVTLFSDINQLGGNIQDGDTNRYKRRISDWKSMRSGFPAMQKFSLTINYRNSREITEHYLALLTESLPTKPVADVPVFEAGAVVIQTVKRETLVEAVGSLLRRLLKENSPSELGVITLESNPEILQTALTGYRFPMTGDTEHDGIVVTTATKIRGHERKVVVVVSPGSRALCRNFGSAIDAYIAMSRAVKQLFIIEVIAT
jgi:hypothetical protein